MEKTYERMVSLPGSEPLSNRRRDARSMNIRETVLGKVDERSSCIPAPGSSVSGLGLCGPCASAFRSTRIGATGSDIQRRGTVTAET